VGEDDEVGRFQHMAEMLYGFAVGGHKLLFLLGQIEFLGEGRGCQAFLSVAAVQH
jgi:hypothetical protein